jgi:hypothetical protein
MTRTSGTGSRRSCGGALELPAAARDAYLVAACGGDADLLARARSLACPPRRPFPLLDDADADAPAPGPRPAIGSAPTRS